MSRPYGSLTRTLWMRRSRPVRDHLQTRQRPGETDNEQGLRPQSTFGTTRRVPSSCTALAAPQRRQVRRHTSATPVLKCPMGRWPKRPERTMLWKGGLYGFLRLILHRIHDSASVKGTSGSVAICLAVWDFPPLIFSFFSAHSSHLILFPEWGLTAKQDGIKAPRWSVVRPLGPGSRARWPPRSPLSSDYDQGGKTSQLFGCAVALKRAVMGKL